MNTLATAAGFRLDSFQLSRIYFWKYRSAIPFPGVLFHGAWTHARTHNIHTHIHTHTEWEREREREILARYKCLTYQRTSYMVCTSMAAIWITQICAVVEINPRRPIQCESNKCPARPDIVELSTLRTDIETESINGSKSIPKLSISAAAWRMLAQSSSRILFAICGQRGREHDEKTPDSIAECFQ